MRYCTAVFLSLSLLATSATAQDIRWKSESMKPGDTWAIKFGDSSVTRYTFKKRKGKAYIVESVSDSFPNRPFVTHLDKDGNYLKWTRPDGYFIRFKPHDCTRTLGKCAYTSLYSDGRREKRTRITRATKNGLQFEEFNVEGQLILKGAFDLDSRGVAGSGSLDGYKGKQKSTLLKRSYK